MADIGDGASEPGAVRRYVFEPGTPDTVPPTTTISGNSSLWVMGPVTLTLSATDASSTVAATYYSTDGSTPTNVYTGPFQVSQEGTVTVKYYSVDSANNEEAEQSATGADIEQLKPDERLLGHQPRFRIRRQRSPGHRRRQPGVLRQRGLLGLPVGQNGIGRRGRHAHRAVLRSHEQPGLAHGLSLC